MLLVALTLAAPAVAISVSVTVTFSAGCDNNPPPEQVDELGNPPAFPAGEAISSSAVSIAYGACPLLDTEAPDALVSITNLTATDFPEVWYVADPETSLSNVDAYLVNGEEAFKIDSAISDPNGLNLPLRGESFTANDIFEAGETWDFVIDDYFNTLGLPASALASAGLVGSFSGGDTVSSGSIIAIPEPGTLLLAGLGLAALALLTRKRLKA